MSVKSLVRVTSAAGAASIQALALSPSLDAQSETSTPGNPTQTAKRERAAVAGRADCLVSRLARRAGSHRREASGPDRGRGPILARFFAMLSSTDGNSVSALTLASQDWPIDSVHERAAPLFSHAASQRRAGQAVRVTARE